jgi:nitrite reductase (NADH) small subunit
MEHRLAHESDIPLGEGREFCVAGHRVAVFRQRDGSLAATQASCPHREGPLADGMVGMGSVVCPLHGRKFSLATGAGDDEGETLTVYTVRRAEDGGILLSLPD